MEAKRQELVECISDSDEILGDMFLEEKVPDNEEIKVRYTILLSSSVLVFTTK